MESKNSEILTHACAVASKIDFSPDASAHYHTWYKLLLASTKILEKISQMKEADEENDFIFCISDFILALDMNASFRGTPELGAVLIDSGILELLFDKVIFL